jgi:hypothetical protein
MRRALSGSTRPAPPARPALAALAAVVCLAVAVLLAGPAAAADEEPFVQGRCVSFDPVSRKVEIVKDLKGDMTDPDYSQFPPASFVLAGSAGPAPKAGRRIKLDAAAGTIILYDPALRTARTFPIRILVKRLRVAWDDPLVYDHAADAPRRLPEVDRAAGTVSMFSRRQDMYLVFAPPAELFELPDEAWDSGDEVRVTFRPDGTVRTYQNLSRIPK